MKWEIEKGKDFKMRKTLILIILLFLTLEAGAAITVNPGVTKETLVNTILGSGISVVPGTISYTGTLAASGTFTGGYDAGIGISSGIVLTSGLASNVDSLNDQDGATGNNGLAGDAQLTALVGATTYDATVLQFDFTSAGGNLFFNYVFASEEYNEYTNSAFNDVFAFFLDNTNIALIPGTSTPVAINTVNGGNPLGTGATNPQYYNNNDLNDGGPFYAIEYDGFTDVFTAQVLGLSAGTHTIRLAIADTSDSILDSGVFIQGGTFSDIETPTVPVPGAILLAGIGAGLVGWLKRGRTL